MHRRMGYWIGLAGCAAVVLIGLGVMAEPAARSEPMLNIGGMDRAGGGVIKGVVRVEGNKPDRKPIRGLTVDAYCTKCWRDREPLLSEDYVWGDNDTLQNVVVYVRKGLEGRDIPQLTEAARLELIDCRFAPHVLAVMTQQPLEIHNRDETLHALRFRSEHNGRFNDDLVKGVVLQKQFASPELGARFSCRAHGWEQAWLLVFDHPYFAMTQQDGTFEIRGLPPGEYEIAVWHEMKNFKPTQAGYKMTVPEQGAGELTITFILPDEK